MGLADLVFPGANHTRFQHALGSMHLAGLAMETLRVKGHNISEEEFTATQLALLLHDTGHGPFSHSLENTLLQQVSHESISYLIMKHFNEEKKGELELCMKIFRDSYSRRFFHQLVSSQIDMDRLDYLKRDSFFTGVPEGNVNTERILQLLNIKDGELVVEEKGIYTLENFLNARRLMYWQVYLHKTSLSAEKLLSSIILRAKDLARAGIDIPATPPLLYFINKETTLDDFSKNDEALLQFIRLDDSDVWGSIKLWQNHSDQILSLLCSMLLQRDLFQLTISSGAVRKEKLQTLKARISEKYGILRSDASYFLSFGAISNEAYVAGGDPINLLDPTGALAEISEAADLPNIKAFSKIVSKYYLCHPKNLYLQD